MVAANFGFSIPEIFATRGEEEFREAESKALSGNADAARASWPPAAGS